MSPRPGLPRWLEVLLAGAALLLVSPLMLLVAALVKLTSRGPILFGQTRVGAGGRTFVIRKFRSMAVHRNGGTKVTARDDARMTPVGRVLRKSKLDELPELWNVVRGDMALVGPRPEVPEYVDWADPVSRSVLRARPGVTDPMTLRLRNEEELLAGVPSDRDAFYRARLRPFKVRGYKDYLTTRSWFSDLLVLVRSVIVVIAPKLARPLSVPEIESGADHSLKAPANKIPTRSAVVLRYRRPVIVVFQAGLVALSHWLALSLRFDGVVPPRELATFLAVLPWIVGLRLVAFVPFRLYEGFWRYSGVWDLENIVAAVVSSTMACAMVVRLGYGFAYSRSVFVVDAFILIVLMGGVRLSFRVAREWSKSGNKTKRVLIFGAGDAGAMIVREMINSSEVGYRPVGFIDDDRAKAGLRIHGIPILGTREDLPAIIKNKRPAEVLLAVPRAEVATIRSMVVSLAPYKVKIKTLPNVRDLLDGSVQISQVRNLAIEDLLPRAPVGLDRVPLRRLIEGKCVMVTGAGGSIGSELCRQIASFRPASLILYERYENSLYTVANDLADHSRHTGVHPVLGDVTDERRLDAVMGAHRPHIVFHAAAHKHVPLMEANACEAVKNNVIGTELVAAAAERHGVDRFILISSDKAVNPSSVMGVTKRIDELIVHAFSARNRTTFITVRFGNVLGSSGSVVPRFLDQIRAGGPVTVTHPDMRRFFMLTSEAVQLVLHAAAVGRNGGTYVLDMGEQINVLELARNLIQLAGFIPDQEISIDFVGLRPGEKLAEELIGEDETVEPGSVHEIMEVHTSRAINDEGLHEQLATLETLALEGDARAVIAQLHRIVPNFRQTADAAAVQAPAKDPGASPRGRSSVMCPSCGSAKVRRARSKTPQERIQKTFTDERLHRCDDCEWRGWLIPAESRDAISVVMHEELNNVDLQSIDSALMAVAVPRSSDPS